MSEELLQRFLGSIEQEDGIIKKQRNKKDRNSKIREDVERILRGVQKGQVEISPEESYIIQNPTSSKSDFVDLKLAAKGYSIVEQARDNKPRDLKKRNLKYMKYQSTRKLNGNKANIIAINHLKKKDDLSSLRKAKNKLIGVKEPKKKNGKKSTKSKSVFTESDFAAVSGKPKRVNKISDHSFL